MEDPMIRMMPSSNGNKRRTPNALVVALPALALVLLGAVAPPAAAMKLNRDIASNPVAGECVGFWAWDFDPILGLNGASGTVHVEAGNFPFLGGVLPPGNVCSFQALPCQPECISVGVFPGEFDAPYIGDCLSATVFLPDGELHIVGGTVVAGVGGSNGISWQITGELVIQFLCIGDGASGPFTVTAEAF